MGAGKRRKKHELRTLAAPFTVAAPSGARIRDRLRLTAAEHDLLWQVGQHLGHHQRADLAERVTIGRVTATQNRRAQRKKALTGVSSSRWAGAMTRASEDQYQLSLRALDNEHAYLRRAIDTISRRLLAPCGQRSGKVRGYADQNERFQKQRRLQMLRARLAAVQQRIEAGHPSIVVGGRRLAKLRHNLADVQLTPTSGGSGGKRTDCSSPPTASPAPRTATTPSPSTRTPRGCRSCCPNPCGTWPTPPAAGTHSRAR